MKIAHISDIHHHADKFHALETMEVDMVVASGDMLDNACGGESDRTVVPEEEIAYQIQWLTQRAPAWVKALRGRPLVVLPGNHDFIDIAPILQVAGHLNTHTLSADNPFVDVCGFRFGGFRNIPWIRGEWVGESHDFSQEIDQVAEYNPDVLVTHAPPGGILDGRGGYGIAALASFLFFGEHKIRAHMFGHEHSCGGQIVERGGILFSNAACNINILELT